MLTANYSHPSITQLFIFFLCIIRWILLASAAFKVTHLPGFLQQSDLPFHLETGYIEVDKVYGVELFYYFIESERNPREDPLLLWLTGGPGCSAFSGLALEIGPLKFRSQKYNGSLPNLVYHPYSWTKISNIIFLDSPVGTGFSFSNHPQGYETGDKSWSKHAEIFLRKWIIDHQQFLSNPLYIAGDSYAGKVVPLVVHNILKGNDLEEQPKFNIQTYAYYLMYIWANSNDVQEALNVKKGKVKEWQRCAEDLNYTEDISSSLIYQLNITTSCYSALVYSGDHDLVVPFVGTKEWVKSLKFSITDRWRSWHVGGQVAG